MASVLGFIVLACSYLFTFISAVHGQQAPIQATPARYNSASDPMLDTQQAVANCWPGQDRPAGDIVLTDLPNANVNCNGAFTFSPAQIQASINQAGCCWVPGNGGGQPRQCDCRDFGASYPKFFQGDGFHFPQAYCVPSNNWDDHMEEFPIMPLSANGTAPSPYCGGDPYIYRLLYQAIRGANNVWSMRYCAIVYHNGAKFTGC